MQGNFEDSDHDQAAASVHALRSGVTAIEYALIASCIALAIVTSVGAAGTQLKSSFTNIASAFP